MASPVVVAMRGDNHAMAFRGCLLLLAQQYKSRKRSSLHRKPGKEQNRDAALKESHHGEKYTRVRIWQCSVASEQRLCGSQGQILV